MGEQVLTVGGLESTAFADVDVHRRRVCHDRTRVRHVGAPAARRHPAGSAGLELVPESYLPLPLIAGILARYGHAVDDQLHRRQRPDTLRRHLDLHTAAVSGQVELLAHLAPLHLQVNHRPRAGKGRPPPDRLAPVFEGELLPVGELGVGP